MTQRNFKTLEVGKYYVSAEAPDTPTKIIERISKGEFFGDNLACFSEDGKVSHYPQNIYEIPSDLITEVTVSITPVVPTKPREVWCIVNDVDEVVMSSFSNKDDANEILTDWHSGKNSEYRVAMFREVMVGEE